MPFYQSVLSSLPSGEVIASFAQTFMATVVAVVALTFSYRQNVGWKPVMLVTNSMMKGIGGSQTYTFVLTVEFWNRRKYPVALRNSIATITGVELIDSDSSRPFQSDYVRKNKVVKQLEIAVEPSSSETLTFEVSFKDQSLDAMRPEFGVAVSYFDPHKNKVKKLKLTHKFFHPDLGWSKTQPQRAAALEAFRQMHKLEGAREEALEEKRLLKSHVRLAVPKAKKKPVRDPKD